MTDELRQLLMQVRDRLESEGLMIGAGPKTDDAIVAWDAINALVGCDHDGPCEEVHERDEKVLRFPTRA